MFTRHVASSGITRTVLPIVALLLFATVAFAESSGDYRSAADGAWSSAATWETFDGASWQPAVSAPTSASGVISLRSPFIVNIALPVTIDETIVESGAVLQIGAGIPLTVANGAGADLTVDGTLENLGSVSSSGATVVFSATGQYTHKYTTSAGAIPTATWAPASRCVFAGYTSNTTPPSNIGQAFGTVRWECPSQSAAINLGGGLTSIAGNLEIASTGTGSLRLQAGGTFTTNIAGDLQVNGGTLVVTSTNGSPVVQVNGQLKQDAGVIDLQMSGTGSSAELRVRGDVTLSGGQFIRSGSSTPKLVLNGSATQLYTSAAPLGSGVWVDITGADVRLGSNLALATLTTLTVTGTLDGTTYAIIGHTFTIGNGGTCRLGAGGLAQLSAGSLNVQAGGLLDVGAASVSMQSSISASISVAGRLRMTSGSISVATPTGANSLSVSNGGTVELGSGTITLGAGSANVYSGGALRCGTGVLTATGAASFSIFGGGTLATASPDGIAATGATGSIRTPTRSFATNARYLYDGAGAQATGTGLPATVRTLRVTGGGAVTLTASAVADSGVAVTDGALYFDGRTLRSSTALVVGATGLLQNTSTGTLTLGGGLVNGGTVNLDGSGVSCGDADAVLIRSATPGVAQAWSGSGTFTLVDVDVADQSGTVNVASGTDSGNNAGWSFTGCSTDVAGDAPFSCLFGPVTPNPVQRTATLSFALPRGGDVRLELFDVAGRRVRSLQSGMLEAGSHVRTLDTNGLSSGVYLARLTTPWNTQVRRVVVVR
jgi:hypothetical protein